MPSGYEIKFLFADDDPDAVNAKDAIVKGLEEAGFKATPVPTTLENATTDRENPNLDINFRSAGWCSDWPSGGSWFPVLHKTEDIEALGQISQNYALFSEPDVDQRIDDVLALPIEDQAAAWGELDKYIGRDLPPADPAHLRRCHPGPRVQGQRASRTTRRSGCPRSRTSG